MDKYIEKLSKNINCKDIKKGEMIVRVVMRLNDLIQKEDCG